MLNRYQRFGVRSENQIAQELERRGYAIVERNFKCPLGEIDIIARHRGQIVFVEVKGRQSLRYGHPKQAITPRKQSKISMVALFYLKRRRQLNCSARFDVAVVLDQRPAGGIHLEIVENAFDLCYG